MFNFGHWTQGISTQQQKNRCNKMSNNVEKAVWWCTNTVLVLGVSVLQISLGIFTFCLSLFVNLVPQGRTWGMAPDELYHYYYLIVFLVGVECPGDHLYGLCLYA